MTALASRTLPPGLFSSPAPTPSPRRRASSGPCLDGEVDMPALQEAPAQQIDTAVLLAALTALKKGDFSARLPIEWTGVAGKVADTFNDVIELNQRMARELERL